MAIYGKIIDLQKLGYAWDHVKKNKPAAGVDKVRWEDFDTRRKEELKQLHLELSEHRYESLPVKLIDFYKEEKVRQISLFSMRDKVVQMSLATELGKIYEPLFSKCSIAYRPGQSALQALDRIENVIRENVEPWVLKMDIADFFDSIGHEILLSKIGNLVREQDVLELVCSVLKAKILDEKTGNLTENRKGIFQGSSCAPLLSNIFLKDFDREMEQRCQFYVRYSDDMLVLESEEEKVRGIYRYAETWLEQNGLKLKESKTVICHLTGDESFEYLGYTFSSSGKSIPQKAVSSLEKRLETMWLTHGMKLEDKLAKGREILGGWEQYYRGEKKVSGIIEYVLVLSMVRNRAPEEAVKSVERDRFLVENIYKDILEYMVAYWKEHENIGNVLREYEQYFQVPGHEEKEPDAALIGELTSAYAQLMIHPDEEVYANIIQLYTDMGCYKKASFFWEKRAAFEREQETQITVPHFSADSTVLGQSVRENREEDKTRTEDDTAGASLLTDGNPLSAAAAAMPMVNLADYASLFVAREDTYVSETLEEGGRRHAEQMLEPLTEDKIREHLTGNQILGTYVQRTNSTVKFLAFDVDVSKKRLLQYSYGTTEFLQYKQKAAEYAVQICAILKKLGIHGYLEDTGFRGYHVWVFFLDWIPVRYATQLGECVQKEIMTWDSEDVTLELFPNKARMRPGKAGQSIKLPLGIHIRSGERSCFLDSDLQPISSYKEFFSGVAKVTLNAVRRILGTYCTAEQEEKADQEQKVVDTDLEGFGTLAEPIRIVLERCTLMRYLCQKARKTGYLTHFERMSILYVFGHMGDDGQEFVHTVMKFTLNYKYNTTQKFIMKIPEKPISCVKLREQYKVVTAEYGCSCSFRQTKNCYPSPVLHALKNSGEEESGITLPMSRTVSKAKEDSVYEEINIHKQTQNLAQRIVELKKQKRGLDKSIQKIEFELQRIFDNAGIDCLEIDMGLLVRRKTESGYEWLIEL